MALNGLYCADVPLSNYSLTYSTVRRQNRNKNKTEIDPKVNKMVC